MNALIALFSALDLAEKLISVVCLVVMAKLMARAWRHKLMNDSAIRTSAIVVAMAVVEWTADWVRAEWCIVFIALCVWHIASRRREKKLKAAKEAAQLMEMTIEQRKR